LKQDLLFGKQFTKIYINRNISSLHSVFTVYNKELENNKVFHPRHSFPLGRRSGSVITLVGRQRNTSGIGWTRNERPKMMDHT